MNQVEFSILLGGQKEVESGCRAARTASGTLRRSIHLLIQPEPDVWVPGLVLLFCHQSCEWRSRDWKRLTAQLHQGKCSHTLLVPVRTADQKWRLKHPHEWNNRFIPAIWAAVYHNGFIWASILLLIYCLSIKHVSQVWYNMVWSWKSVHYDCALSKPDSVVNVVWPCLALPNWACWH